MEPFELLLAACFVWTYNVHVFTQTWTRAFRVRTRVGRSVVQGVRAWRLGSSNVREREQARERQRERERERERERVRQYGLIHANPAKSPGIYREEEKEKEQREGEKRRQSYPATPPVRTTRQTIIHHRQTTITTTTTSELVVLPATFSPSLLSLLLFSRLSLSRSPSLLPPRHYPLFDPVKGLSPSRMPCHLLKRIISLFETLAIL